jgi:hypothetical protein
LPNPPKYATQRRLDGHVVVTVGEHEQRGQPLDAAGEEGQRVEARVVGPVHVLHHHHGHRAARELVEQRSEHGLHVGRCQRAGQRRAGLAAQVEHRPQGARGQQVVTGALADRDTGVQPGEERPHQRRLAHPGAAADERDTPPAAPRRRECHVQVGERRLPFQQWHDPRPYAPRPG